MTEDSKSFKGDGNETDDSADLLQSLLHGSLDLSPEKGTRTPSAKSKASVGSPTDTNIEGTRSNVGEGANPTVAGGISGDGEEAGKTGVQARVVVVRPDMLNLYCCGVIGSPAGQKFCFKEDCTIAAHESKVALQEGNLYIIPLTKSVGKNKTKIGTYGLLSPSMPAIMVNVRSGELDSLLGRPHPLEHLRMVFRSRLADAQEAKSKGSVNWAGGASPSPKDQETLESFAEAIKHVLTPRKVSFEAQAQRVKMERQSEAQRILFATKPEHSIHDLRAKAAVLVTEESKQMFEAVLSVLKEQESRLAGLGDLVGQFRSHDEKQLKMIEDVTSSLHLVDSKIGSYQGDDWEDIGPDLWSSHSDIHSRVKVVEEGVKSWQQKASMGTKKIDRLDSSLVQVAQIHGKLIADLQGRMKEVETGVEDFGSVGSQTSTLTPGLSAILGVHQTPVSTVKQCSYEPGDRFSPSQHSKPPGSTGVHASRRLQEAPGNQHVLLRGIHICVG
ncbi:hypothetical protein SEMRO_1736_G294370.1 [Seminavis robusta]|uniref:Uncharacterized protein n=1 Tax=Seminavis robusta TaxID=568900 RepID=A0A9N8ERF7_9STRA|nr:hypothetical protein SEMRO_1736_G294370.1 [Seminavis robusta]|eukprot:Sro1736_g294370.1 n/a (500) ;mRNA; r:5152-6734